ncbi:ABC transporter ATP-binding protein [Desulfatitalea alkaliphila]|uniref:ABC transporter ATP-binding protein n=1 Tax=Desulfatitalea alkaliphila TaxID=2929485 RepID=A0AA41R5X3_9BACT|nr:ABC transporter ATP-binding protein [Desulfatitalea alkaliphila]MCJ8502944.1 ABC transporter ATP-binding protein [Desulfatitalea alkaliphila]
MSKTAAPLLAIEQLTAGYGPITAIKGVSLAVTAGQVVSIIGANGAGKTTLLKAVSGMNRATRGRIVFNGREITRLAADRIVSLGLSQVAEGRQIFAHMSVADNIELGAYLFHRQRKRQLIDEGKEAVYTMFPVLAKRAGQIAGTLSGGEQQMLAIARALMARPTLLLLDEPSMGLAPLIVRDIFRTIEQLHAGGTTILLVEQNARAALQVADYAYVLETGRVVLEGPARQLADDPKVKRAYLGIG